MFSLSSARAALRAPSRAFSSTSRTSDMAKLVLIGRLGKDPEVRYTKNEKEYVLYHVATTNSVPPSVEGATPTTTWHTVFSFNPGANNYLRALKRGSLVYAETHFELRQPDVNASPDTNEGQRQIFLRHESIKLLRGPKHVEEHVSEEESQ